MTERKYYIYGNEQMDQELRSICYAERSKGLFQGVEQLYLDAVYLYEEDGVVYEFFTGQEYGRMRGTAGREELGFYDDYIESPYVLISLRSHWTCDEDYARQLSVSDFAGRLKKYERDAELIKTAMADRLRAIKAIRNKEKEEKEAEKKRVESEIIESKTWLDSLAKRLGNR